MHIFDGADAGRKIYCNGARGVAPEDTIARASPFLTTFGITRVANLTGLDRTGIPVVMVCRPNARSSAVFHGKGFDIGAAKASGLMEAIETWHAENMRLPLRFGRLAELRSALTMVDVDGLPSTQGPQFDQFMPMLWVEGRDIMNDVAVWLPFEIVHANSTISGPPASGCFAASTNGLASGNHILEAVSHALCELIERDATSLWRHRRRDEQDRRRLDLGTVNDQSCRAILEKLSRVEIDVAVWDVTTDVGVSTFYCVVVDRTGDGGHVGVGAGCHPKREIALLRSVTEAAQVRTTYIVGSREDIDDADYDSATLAARNLRTRALMRDAEQSCDFASIGSIAFETFEAEVAWLLDRLRSVKVRQAIVVDLTRPEFGIPVVRVVAPGLEGSDHHAGYSPGARAQALKQRT
jgi:YcaO-like protein with predicted kinase domain